MAVVFACLCTFLPLWCANRYGVIRYFSPLHICGGLAFLGITLKVITYQLYPDIAFYLRYTTDTFALFWGTFYVTLFIVSLCFGYLLLCTKRRFVPVLFKPGHMPALRYRKLLMPTAIATTLLVTHMLFSQRGLSVFDPQSFLIVNTVKQYGLNANSVGSTGALVKVFYTIPRTLFVLCVLWAMSTGRRDAIFAAAVTFVALIFAALASGDRFDLARLLLFTGISLSCAGWVFKFRSLITSIILVFTIIAAVGLMSSLRKANQQDTVDLSVASSIANVVEQVTGSTYFMDVNVSAILVETMDPRYTLYGETYTWWTFGWIPRVFWPDKPSTDAGTYLKRDVLGHGSTSVGAINVTGPGEAFINFRWAGVAFGFLLGVMFRSIELLLLFHRHSTRHTFIYYPVVAVPLIVACLQSSFSAALVSAALAAVLCGGTKAIFLSDGRRLRLRQRPPSHSMVNLES